MEVELNRTHNKRRRQYAGGGVDALDLGPSSISEEHQDRKHMEENSRRRNRQRITLSEVRIWQERKSDDDKLRQNELLACQPKVWVLAYAKCLVYGIQKRVITCATIYFCNYNRPKATEQVLRPKPAEEENDNHRRLSHVVY